MKISENTPILTQQFISEFSCIGGMCEDDCCHGWAINIEKKSLLTLNKLYQNVSEKKHVRLSALKHNKQATTEWDYGIIKIQPNQPCPFLNPGGLCDIHGRFGQDRLGWMCKDYPRTLVKIFDQLELRITLSCPEAARLCLLRPASTQPAEVNQEIRHKFSENIDVPPANIADSPYLELFYDIRQIMMLLADARQYSTNGRLYLMLYFANRINDFFHANTTSFSIDKLNREIEHIADPDTHSRLVSSFLDQAYDPSLSITATQALLTFSSDHQSEFNDFVRTCLGSCKDPSIEKLDQMDCNSFATVIQTYLDRRKHIEELYWPRLEEYFTNYVLYYLFNRWYLATPTLLNYLRDLFIQINIIKFVFFMNPQLDPLLYTGKPENTDETNATNNLLDKTIVQTVYQCARGFEHLHPILVKIISQALDEQGINNFEKLSLLAKT